LGLRRGVDGARSVPNEEEDPGDNYEQDDNRGPAFQTHLRTPFEIEVMVMNLERIFRISQRD
jgi:hypothetical protein